MLRKRTDNLGTVEDERTKLHQQWLELDALKRELSERVRAVEERERELQAVLAEARRAGSPLPPRSHSGSEAVTAQTVELERRAAGIAARERELMEREHALAGGDAATVVLPAAPSSDEQRLAELEERLSALQEAEQAFMRTQQELSARSDAVTQRERMVSQRERELDGREDVADASPEVAELEARLRRLEQQRSMPPPPPTPSVEDTQGFSGGFKRLEDKGTRRRP